MTISPLTVLALLGLTAGAVALVTPLEAQGGRADGIATGIDEARGALDAARRQQRSARARGERFEQAAARADARGEQALQKSAALAARIQQAEAGITAAEAALVITARERRMLDRRLSLRREPLVRLTAALEAMARRPLALSALQPGSLTDLVHTRAVLASAVPRVREQTAGLRADLDRSRVLENETADALRARRDSFVALASRRKALVALASREQATAWQSANAAEREKERALVLASETRDLRDLVERLEAARSLRDPLVAPNASVRRSNPPGVARDNSVRNVTQLAPTGPPRGYQLPANGRVITRFGDLSDQGAPSRGVVLVPRGGAQVVAPGGGHVAFAGAYRGYGLIVIIEHGGGWTSLVTGLAALDTEVGSTLAAGSPVGLAPARDPRIVLELRHDGETVDALDHVQ